MLALAGLCMTRRSKEEIKRQRQERHRNLDVREARNAYQRRVWNDTDPDTRRTWHLRKRYGITHEQREALIEAQKFTCPACGEPFDKDNLHRLHIDHVHGTKTIRGILHAGCNTALGHFYDSVEGLTRALVYVSMGATSVELVDEHY